jgi:Glyoxalase-like domain
MQQTLTLLFLYFSLNATAQTSKPHQAFVSIDHIPVVVKNLDSIKKLLSGVFYFQIKEGKEHEGIKNCFIKFQDGTYLEFINPVDSLYATGKYYTDFLNHRQGGTVLAISVTNADIITRNLKAGALSFEADSSKIWKTISPVGADLFFIDYSDKTWKDSKINTTHPNMALQLKSAYLISGNLKAAISKYKSLGFRQIKNSNYSGIPCKQIVIGQSNLYFLDASKANKLTAKFKMQNLKGICGFEIKVSSLAAINKLLPKTDNIVIADTNTICYLPEYNFFINFSE